MRVRLCSMEKQYTMCEWLGTNTSGKCMHVEAFTKYPFSTSLWKDSYIGECVFCSLYVSKQNIGENFVLCQQYALMHGFMEILLALIVLQAESLTEQRQRETS